MDGCERERERRVVEVKSAGEREWEREGESGKEMECGRQNEREEESGRERELERVRAGERERVCGIECGRYRETDRE